MNRSSILWPQRNQHLEHSFFNRFDTDTQDVSYFCISYLVIGSLKKRSSGVRVGLQWH